MKKILITLLMIALLPIVVFADEGDEPSVIDNSSTTSSTTSSTSNEVTTSPDTGVEDYFITLGIISVFLGGILYIVNKKNVFTEV